MNRNEKVEIVGQIKESLERADATFVVDYKGLVVSDMQKIRNELRQGGAVLKVSKVRLMSLAATDVGVDEKFKDSFGGQIALVFVSGEVPTIAKKLVNFAEKSDNFFVKAGFFESKFLSEQDVKALATLPSRPELIAMCAGALMGPIAGLARSLNGVVGGLARSLKCVAEKYESGGS